MTDVLTGTQGSDEALTTYDAVVVGAGFAGLYMLHRLRGLGLSARVYEAGGDVGGTWYWNRYPGARCDVESLDYCYSFDPDLRREWKWTERYPTQPEILRYIDFVAERYDLRRDIQFETRVVSAEWDEDRRRWLVTTDRGDRVACTYCVMATGCLSVPKLSEEFDGEGRYQGEKYYTSRWPHEGVDFTGKRVAVIGTGSSAIQSIPVIAEQAAALTVYQRTANFSVPAHNGPLDRERERYILENFEEYRELARANGLRGAPAMELQSIYAVSEEERQKKFEECWEVGGLMFLGSFLEVVIDKNANDIAAEFVRSKIRSIVKDPEKAEKLCPKHVYIGTKRLCVDTGYYDTFNKDHVDIVDLREDPIVELTPSGIRTRSGEREFDAVVFATGFDAMTGALNRIDIRGRGGRLLRDKWADGPRTYLGIGVAGFPNLFTITGPGSPSVLSNMIISIEQHVEWLSELFEYMRENDHAVVEATEEAEDDWVQTVNVAASVTLFPQAESWYTGANVPGKPRVFMPFVGGTALYRQKCDEVASKGYEGFTLR